MSDAALQSRIDPRRDINRWLGNYSEDHRNATNVLIHEICVPAILWSAIAMLWVLPVPPALGRAGLWSAAAMFFAFVFYMKLSRRLAFGMLLVFVVFGASSEALFRMLGPAMLLKIGIGVFVIAWIGQFIGHKIEGRKPSFLTDLSYLLVGPVWILAKVLRHFGIAY